MSTSPFRAKPWKLRFWFIFAGQCISLLGSSVVQFVLIWWVTEKTGSISDLSLAGIAGLLPRALLGPIGGVFADRYNRQVIMIIADMFSAACMIAVIPLFYCGIMETTHIYVLLSLRSAANAFQTPAASACTSMLVPVNYLSLISGARQTFGGILLVFSAPFGAVLIDLFPIYWVLGIDIITVFFGVIPLLVFVVPQPKLDNKSSTMIAQFHDGVLVVWRRLGLRYIFIISSFAVMVITPLASLAPMLVKNHFNGGASHLAYFQSVAGVGFVAGGCVTMLLRPKRRVLWAILGYLLACIFVSATAAIPSDYFNAAALLWGISRVAFIVGGGALHALLQATIPNSYQGRVLSLLSTIVAFSAPIGLAITGGIGEVIETRWLFIIFGGVAAIIVCFSFMSESIMSLGKVRT